MDVYKTHGAFSWSELMTTDVDAAKSFYMSLFGWGARDMAMPSGNYTTMQVGEASVGGVMKIPAEAEGMPPNWGVYVTVNNVDETLGRVAQLGGKVVMPPMEVPGVGRMAVVSDPQGATFSVITYSF
jgi:predicted enzyme related to lactoylglutathione lyase